jgi:hypothetical protein
VPRGRTPTMSLEEAEARFEAWTRKRKSQAPTQTSCGRRLHSAGARVADFRNGKARTVKIATAVPTVGGRFVRLVATRFAMKIHRRIARFVRVFRPAAAFPAKALQARACFQQRPVDCEMFVRGQLRLLGLIPDHREEDLATSCSSSRSRFFVNTVASHTGSSMFIPTSQRNSTLYSISSINSRSLRTE